MARFRLQVLAPGKWAVGKNADGTTRFHEFTADEIRNKAQATMAMRAAGYNVPTCFEHQDRARPVKLSRDQLIEERTRGVNGWKEKLFIDKATGKCFADVEVPHADDAKTVDAIRFCSPEIDEFVAPDGTNFGEVFTHLAFTPRPVQTNQDPAVRLSTDAAASPKRMRLAFDPKDGKDTGDKPADTAKPSKQSDSPPPNEPPKGDGEAAGAPVDKSLIAALLAAGFAVPKTVATQRELAICVESQAAAMKQPEPDPRDAQLEEVSPGQGGAGGGATPMLMSLEAKIVERERKDVLADLDNLLTTGRAKPPEIAAQKKKLTAARLSLNDKGDVMGHAAVTLWIDSRKVLEPGSVFPLTNDQNKQRLSIADSTTEITPPPSPDELTPERKAELKEHARQTVEGGKPATTKT